VDIARFVGRDFGRGDYRRISAAGLTSAATIEGASDDVILEQLEGDREKLRFVRTFAENARLREREMVPVQPLLPYQA
jgi:hypothetical protein